MKLGDRFVRTHRAYLVAADKIEEVDWKHHKLWLGGRECLISRGGKAELFIVHPSFLIFSAQQA